MKLEDYFKVRCGHRETLSGLAVNAVERRLFKITDTSRGWFNRIKDTEIPDSVIAEVCRLSIQNSSSNQQVKSRLRNLLNELGSFKKPSKEELNSIGKEYFYIIKDEFDRTKVGVSKTPKTRAKDISTSAGISCTLIAYYNGEEHARTVERSVLAKFKPFQHKGEWFKAGTVTQKDIEDSLPSSYYKVGC